MTIRAQISFAAIEGRAVGKLHRRRGAQRKITGFVRRVASKASYFGRIANKFLGVDTALLNAFNKTFIGVTTLTIIGVGVRGIPQIPMAGRQILRARTAHAIFGFRSMAINALFRKHRRLRRSNWREQN
jgi:hypothetical protein